MVTEDSLITGAIKTGVVGAKDDILAAGVVAVGISVVLLGGKKAYKYFRGLWSV